MAHILKRSLSTLIDAKGRSAPKDFSLFPNVFTMAQQRILLGMALEKLDAAESRQSRRRRNTFKQSMASSSLGDSPSDLFLPDEWYQMEEGHYDGVINCYREMHLTSWPDDARLAPAILRLRSFFPSADIQTHLLHLGTRGEILPHVDNVGASGTWILGVSLGSERILRMESTTNATDSFDVLLPSGSIYIQRGDVRFGYKHSVLRNGTFLGRQIIGGPRLSIMVRDRLPTGPSES